MTHSVHIVPTTICGGSGPKEAAKIYNGKLRDVAAGDYVPLDQQEEQSVSEAEAAGALKPKAEQGD